jgi:hypothetical protein
VQNRFMACLASFILWITFFTAIITENAMAQATDDAVVDYILSLKSFRADRHYPNIPEYSKEDYQKALKTGEGIVHTKDDPSVQGEKMATFLQIVNVPVWKLWATFVDRNDYEQFTENMKESINLETGPNRLVTYNYLDIPVPLVTDRYQVLESGSNTKLFEASSGKMWEYYWNISPNAQIYFKQALDQNKLGKVSKKDAQDATLMARNDSCWLLVPLPNGKTLMEAFSQNNPGGSLPKGLAQSMAGDALQKTLKSMMKWIGANFDKHFATHEKILSPKGDFVDASEIKPLMPQ